MFNKLEKELMIIREKKNINKIHINFQKRRQKELEKNSKNLSKFDENYPQFQEAQQNPSKRNMKKMSPRRIIMKLTSLGEKFKITQKK